MEINEFIAEEISYKVRKYSYSTKTTMSVRTKSATAILQAMLLDDQWGQHSFPSSLRGHRRSHADLLLRCRYH